MSAYLTCSDKEIVPDMGARLRKLERTQKILFPFACIIIPFCTIALMVVMTKTAKCRMLHNLSRGVMKMDSVLLVTLFGYNPNAADIVKRLIATGNIRGMRLVADVMLVKDGVEMSEEKVKNIYESMVNPILAATHGLVYPLPVGKDAPEANAAEGIAASPVPESAEDPGETAPVSAEKDETNQATADKATE